MTVLIVASPTTAATASNEGLSEKGESLNMAMGNINKLEQISIPAELTIGEVFFSLLPYIPAKL